MNSVERKSLLYRKISHIISGIYLLVLYLLSQTSDLINSIYQNNVWIELSFILFITYLILYIKDAITSDFIELILQKKEKSFLPHLVEHTLEPLIIFIFFLITTRILLAFNMDSILLRFFIIVITPVLYFLLKKKIIKMALN